MTAARQKAKGKRQKVWRITDFRELFELTDDVRKNRPGPLTYTKSIVTVSGLSKEAEVRHFEMMRILKARQERHLLRSTFEDLKNWTAGKHFGPRGYLVTTDGKPANYEYLAAQLEQLKVEELKQAMPILEEIGLIEKVSFNGSLDLSGQKRTKPDSSGRKRTPLKKRKDKNKRKTKKKSKSKNNSGNGKPLRAKDNRQGESQHSSARKSKTNIKTNSKSTTAPAPATTPPIMPQASDAGESKVISFAKAPPESVQDNRSEPQVAQPQVAQPQVAQPQVIGDIVTEIQHRYDRIAQQFAREIYKALALPWHIDSIQARRELGSFASVLNKSRQWNLSQSALSKLWDRAHLEAQRISKRKNKNENRAAIWCDLFRRLLTSAVSKQCKVM